MDRSGRLDGLQEQLLRAGMPRRYARRVVREMREHHADLVDELLAAGYTAERADDHAWRRLGDIAALAAAIVDSNPQRAFVRAHPLLAFIALPLLLFPLGLAALGAAAYAVYLATTAIAGSAAGDPTIVTVISVFHLITWYGAAPLAAMACCEFAGMHRCHMRWPLASCMVLAILGGCFALGYSLPTAGPGSGRLVVAFTSACSVVRSALPLAVFAAWTLVRQHRSENAPVGVTGLE